MTELFVLQAQLRFGEYAPKGKERTEKDPRCNNEIRNLALQRSRKHVKAMLRRKKCLELKAERERIEQIDPQRHSEVREQVLRTKKREFDEYDEWLRK